MEVGILQVYEEHSHSLIERSSYGLGSLHLEPFVDKKVFRSLSSITGLRSAVFGNQKDFAVEARSIDVVNSFQSIFVHLLLNFVVDLRVFAVQVELRL